MTVPRCYIAWYCPFAQRAWIALLQKGVEFEYVEQDPYNKTPEWLEINPKGLVPVIVHKGKSVCDSKVCIEYVDEAWPDSNNLMPEDPYQKAVVRMWSDHINQNIASPFYALLKKKTQDERQKSKDEILSGVRLIVENMSSEGPFFMGAEFGMVDIMLAPFALRIGIVAKFYRDFDIPESVVFARYYSWWKAVKELPSFKCTVPPADRLVKHYSEYAD